MTARPVRVTSPAASSFSITGPIAILVVTIAMGARALAGEEESRTMDLLLGNPITRSHLIVQKSIAMAQRRTRTSYAVHRME